MALSLELPLHIRSVRPGRWEILFSIPLSCSVHDNRIEWDAIVAFCVFPLHPTHFLNCRWFDENVSSFSGMAATVLCPVCQRQIVPRTLSLSQILVHFPLILSKGFLTRWRCRPHRFTWSRLSIGTLMDNFYNWALECFVSGLPRSKHLSPTRHRESNSTPLQYYT